MGGGQENRSSRWGVPLAVVLLARASCHSLGLSLGPASPPSQQNEPIFIFRLVVLIALKLAHMKLRIPKQTGQHSAWEFHFRGSHETKENIGVCYIFWRITGLRSCNERSHHIAPNIAAKCRSNVELCCTCNPTTPVHKLIFNLYIVAGLWKNNIM